MGKIHEASIFESASATDGTQPDPRNTHHEALLNRMTEMYQNTKKKPVWYKERDTLFKIATLIVSILTLLIGWYLKNH